LGRGRELWSSLCLSALVVLICQPLQLFMAGFQLSYLATMSLLWFVPPLARRLPGVVGRWRVPFWLRQALAAALAAQVLVLPAQLYYFGRYPLAGMLATPPAAALTALQLWGGMGAGILGLVGGWPAQALNVLVGLCARATLALVQGAAALGALDWGRPGAVGLGYYAVAALVALWWTQGQLRPRWAIANLAALALGALPLALVSPSPEVVCFDVGQGDSTLLRLPGATVLVDGGGSPGYSYDIGGQVLAPALRALGVRYLDVVIATHSDLDHLEGLVSLARSMPVGLLVLGAAGANDPAYAPLVAAMPRTPVRLVQRGEVWRMGVATLSFLNPPPRPYPRSDNNNSVVLRLNYGQTSLLIAGDIEAAAESDIAPLAGPVAVLRVAHHGARTSSTPGFLRQVQPQVAVVSVGKNPFGHPHPAVLARLAALGRVWRTDQDGAARLALDRRRDLQELGAGPWLSDSR
ncbi:MAG: ComEC family DNA internalization-related competence protein, partial [Deinococcus sp.]|nr:ComEC family DNA internalization-related competence protein [Deinococcus sp.]